MPQASIVPFSYRGYVFPQGVAAGTAAIWTRALDRLTAAGWVLPPDPNPFKAGMWGADNRRKSSGNGWSFHAYGLALDLAAPWNPVGRSVPKPSPYRLPSGTGELVRDLGIMWGGGPGGFDDWHHLELHASPGELAGIIGAAVRGATVRPFPLPAGYYYGPYSGGASRSISGGYTVIDPTWRSGLYAAQRALGVAPDGIFGPLTLAATKRFQSGHGLVADGLIGPKTWAALGPAV